MNEYIKVRAVSLRQLFSGDYVFRLPWFQRAYAWQIAEAGRLLTNLFDVIEEPDEKRRRYFLGSLMLARKDGDVNTSLVDGHQRVMTFTILFAVLRDLSTNPASRAQLQSLIGEGSYRLQTQESLTRFCEQYVQTPGATDLTPDGGLETLSETERNVIENRDYFRMELSSEDVPEDVRALLIETLVDRCFVIVEEVSDEDEAWRILEIEEATRREFNPADRAKASLLAIIPERERGECQKIWEDCAFKLGSHDMHAVLGHVRTLKLRKRSERPAETDLAQVFALNKSGLPFVRDALAPATVQLHALRKREVGTLRTRPAIAASIDRMMWIESNLWTPAAMHWLERRGESGETELFFARLERLVWLLRLAGIDPTRQQRQIIRLIGEIDKDAPVSEMRELEIPRAMRDSALANLRSHTFDAKHYAPRVLRRISLQLGQDPGQICASEVTIEHVLPRGWIEGSPWRRHFTSEKSVKSYAHRLGNLTFLPAKENRAADSCDWLEKRKIYSASRFAMTRDLAGIDDWSAAVIEERTERLARLIFKGWDLPV